MPDNEPYGECPYCGEPAGDGHTFSEVSCMKIIGCPKYPRNAAPWAVSRLTMVLLDEEPDGAIVPAKREDHWTDAWRYFFSAVSGSTQDPNPPQ